MRIGATFGSEIIAAGLGGLPFVWDSEGITFSDDFPTDKRAAVEAVLASHNPLAVLPKIGTTKEELQAQLQDLAEKIAAL